MDRSRLDECLSRVLEGEAEPGDAEALAAAMRQDQHFAREVNRLFAIDDLLRQAHEPDPDAFAAAVQTRLTAEESGDAFTRAVLEQLPAADGITGPTPAATPPDDTRPKGRPAWRRPAFWAAVAVSLVGGVWWLARARTPSGARSRSARTSRGSTTPRTANGRSTGPPSGDSAPAKCSNSKRALPRSVFRPGPLSFFRGRRPWNFSPPVACVWCAAD
ncbi:hypothetical protein FTUN_8255 [Frigoriglobus tundricola]|uniref:Anti sigma-E protein RseA N-terminal domain-containing protein n=1 Tax=Frigoriglobus tundricola TaxID=2774151 RepID=A0A6M5Z5T2_9BACT|nr:hypothetical protein FTUN_8255 [Frigoriglobus tundricola]